MFVDKKDEMLYNKEMVNLNNEIIKLYNIGVEDLNIVNNIIVNIFNIYNKLNIIVKKNISKLKTFWYGRFANIKKNRDKLAKYKYQDVPEFITDYDFIKFDLNRLIAYIYNNVNITTTLTNLLDTYGNYNIQKDIYKHIISVIKNDNLNVIPTFKSLNGDVVLTGINKERLKRYICKNDESNNVVIGINMDYISVLTKCTPLNIDIMPNMFDVVKIQYDVLDRFQLEQKPLAFKTTSVDKILILMDEAIEKEKDKNKIINDIYSILDIGNKEIKDALKKDINSVKNLGFLKNLPTIVNEMAITYDNLFTSIDSLGSIYLSYFENRKK